MELDGVVQNGVIVPQGECSLPEGTKVRITAEPELQTPTIWDKLRQLAEKYESQPCDLPSDLSINYDHYLYGTPKRKP
jgi:predicted DNA-binding antitoxin AbrB/MazE fold protein